MNRNLEERKYPIQRGKLKYFNKDTMLPGEVAEILDAHTLAFCFGVDDVICLNIDEKVNEEVAKELIFRIKQFIENSYWVSRRMHEEFRPPRNSCIKNKNPKP